MPGESPWATATCAVTVTSPLTGELLAHVVATDPAPVACCAPEPGILTSDAVGAVVPQQRKPGSVIGVVAFADPAPLNIALGARAHPPPVAVNG